MVKTFKKWHFTIVSTKQPFHSSTSHRWLPIGWEEPASRRAIFKNPRPALLPYLGALLFGGGVLWAMACPLGMPALGVCAGVLTAVPLPLPPLPPFLPPLPPPLWFWEDDILRCWGRRSTPLLYHKRTRTTTYGKDGRATDQSAGLEIIEESSLCYFAAHRMNHRWRK